MRAGLAASAESSDVRNGSRPRGFSIYCKEEPSVNLLKGWNEHCSASWEKTRNESKTENNRLRSSRMAMDKRKYTFVAGHTNRNAHDNGGCSHSTRFTRERARCAPLSICGRPRIRTQMAWTTIELERGDGEQKELCIYGIETASNARMTLLMCAHT